MNARVNVGAVAPEVKNVISCLCGAVQRSGLENPLLCLLRLRITQMHGCESCALKQENSCLASGEWQQKVESLEGWKDVEMGAIYTARERAALAFAEAMTKPCSTCGIPEEVMLGVRSQFSEREIAMLSLAVIAANSADRLSMVTGVAVCTDFPRGGTCCGEESVRLQEEIADEETCALCGSPA